MASLVETNPGNPGTAVATSHGEASMQRRVAGNSAWLIAQPLLLNILSIASTGYIARKLGATDYGAFNLGYAQIALFSPLCNLGLRAVAIRAIAENRDNAERVIGTVFALRLLLTGIAALAAILWLALPAYSLTTRLIGLVAVVSMVESSLEVVALDLFQGFEQAKLAARPMLLGGLLVTVLSVLALVCGLGLPGFVGAYLTGHTLRLAILFRAARGAFFRLKPVWDREAIRGLALQFRPFVLLGLMGNMLDAPVLDVILLGIFYATAVVGPYAVAIGLVTRLLVVPQGIADAMYPAVANRYHQSREEVEAVLGRSMLMLLLLTVPISICLTFDAPAVVWLLFGEQYHDGALVLQVAGWLLPLSGLSYLLRQCLCAVHQQETVVRIGAASCGLLLVLFAICIPLFGPVGAAVAGLIREAVMLVVWLRASAAHFHRRLPSRQTRRAGLALAVMVLPFGVLLFANTYLNELFASAGAIVSYAVAIPALGVVELRSLLHFRH